MKISFKTVQQFLALAVLVTLGLSWLFDGPLTRQLTPTLLALLAGSAILVLLFRR